MIPNKRLEPPAQRRTRLRFPDYGRVDALHDERALTGRDAPEIVNFRVGRRALTDAPGLTVFAGIYGQTILALFVYRRYDRAEGLRRDALVAWCENGKCYERGLYDGTAFLEIAGLTFSERPRAANYKLNGEDVLVLCSAADGMKVYDGEAVRSVPGAPEVTSLCVHYERLFVTVAGERNAIWFSDDLDITNWNVSLDGAGFIEMADGGGALLAAVSFADRVYVFRRYSVARLTAYADQTEFSLATLYVSSGRLLEDTVCVCGDRIMFAAQNGIFVFDGVSTTKLLDRLDGLLDLSLGDASACYSQGVYYLLARRADRSMLLLAYDVNTGEETLLDFGQLSCVCAADIESESSVFAVPALNASSVFRLDGAGMPQGRPRVYRSRTVPLREDGRRARLARGSIRTAEDIRLALVTDEGREEFAVAGGGIRELSCSLRGREMRFEILAEGNGHTVGPPAFEVLSLD